MQKLIDALLSRAPVAIVDLEEALGRVLAGEVEDVLIAGLLVALRTRPVDGPTLAAMARVLRSRRVALETQVRPLVDTCGTGGDGAGTFNVSTAAALVVVAAGGAVAKHGNRSVSSKTGSADVLEALGVALELTPAAATRLLDSVGFAFLFAPRYHPTIARVMPARRALGIRTHFNLLGPLVNPALAEYQLLGVYAPELTRPVAEALLELGSRGALVVHCAGIDEIGLHAPTRGHRVFEGAVQEFELDSFQLGLARVPLDALAGGDAQENAALLTRVLSGEESPYADAVAVNAGAACWIAGLAPDAAQGLELARAALREGRAAQVLERVVESSQRLAENGA